MPQYQYQDTHWLSYNSYHAHYLCDFHIISSPKSQFHLTKQILPGSIGKIGHYYYPRNTDTEIMLSSLALRVCDDKTRYQ